MSMETGEDVMAGTPNNSSGSISNECCSQPIAKGKRTKRRRLHRCSPVPVAADATSATSSGGVSGGTDEEEDMANCLILLAQGRTLPAVPKSAAELDDEEGGGSGDGEKFRSRRLADAATTTNGKVGFYVYECKTCNKCFPSFQALGGHRSSHKKLKTATLTTMITSEEKRASTREDSLQVSPNSSINLPKNNCSSVTTTPVLHDNSINRNKQRMHECSICGLEFSSGQALGGHMRRHRAAPPSGPEHKELRNENVEKKNLTLDLNLPAPADDERGDFPKAPSLGYAGKHPLVFSPAALVDCHY